MSVGSGSIKRAAKKAADCAADTEQVLEGAAVEETGKETETAQGSRSKSSKSSSAKTSKTTGKKKSSAKSSKTVSDTPSKETEKVIPTEAGKQFMADEAARSTNESCQLTQEMPVYLL